MHDFPATRPGPNALLLQAQARVCTGPHQTRPLGKTPDDSPQPSEVIETILGSLRGTLPREQQVSAVQLGAFFAAMTLRRHFPAATQWSPAEVDALDAYADALASHLPAAVRFLQAPTTPLAAQDAATQEVVAFLQRILRGEHLSYEETYRLLEHLLEGSVDDALTGAALIGQRMNIEDDEEVRAYLDVVFPPSEVRTLPLPSLTHFGEPYNGATRSQRLVVFAAAIRAALGRPTLLHGVDLLPPKLGTTEEQVLAALGANTRLSLTQAASALQDPALGFAYLSQREFAPKAYEMREVRLHIKKRPPFATTEKAQQLFRSSEKNYMVIGFYHSGYEYKLLQSLWDRGFDAGLVAKGQEGTSFYSLRAPAPSTPDKKTVNYTEGFRRDANARLPFAQDIDPSAHGFVYRTNPKPTATDPHTTAQQGLAILSGQSGPEADRLILTIALQDHLLGICPDLNESFALVREAIASKRAHTHLQHYIQRSHTF